MTNSVQRKVTLSRSSRGTSIAFLSHILYGALPETLQALYPMWKVVVLDSHCWEHVFNGDSIS